MSDKTKKLKLTQQECLTMLLASTQGIGTRLAGVDWSCFLALISCDNELMKYDKAIAAAQEVKNIGEGKSKAEGAKLVESWEAFAKECEELKKKHAMNDVDGSPLTSAKPDGTTRIRFSDPDAFAKEFKAVQDEHKDAIDARNEQLKRVQKKLESEVTVTLPVITRDQLPKDITQAALQPFAKLLVAQ